MNRSLAPIALLALFTGCPEDGTDTWPDPDLGSDVDTDADTDTNTIVNNFTAHCGPVEEDEIWRRSGNPHLLGCDLEVISGTITVEPGVEVYALGDATIELSEGGQRSSLRVNGTEANPVLFTVEVSDDETARWGGIIIHGDADNVSFSHTRIERTGASFSQDNLTVYDNTIHVDHLTLADGLGDGLRLLGSSRLSDDSEGLVVDGTSSYPVSVSATWAHTLPSIESDYSGNGETGPLVRGGAIEQSVTWEDLGVPYLVDGTVEVAAYIDRPAVLTIGSGAEVRFSVGDALQLAPAGGEAGLVTSGTADNPVVLSARGADTGGFWRGIVANRGTSTLDLAHTIVAFGGRGLTTLSAIDVQDTEIRVDNLTIQQSERMGIALTGTSRFTDDSTGLTVTGCTFPGRAPSMTIQTVPDGSLTGNTVDAFQVQGAIVSPTLWPRLDVPYWVNANILVDGYADVPAVLTIEPGTEVWFANNTRMEFSSTGGAAALDAQGTPNAPIVFTAAQFAERGAWDGLWFRDQCEDDAVVMDNFVVEYGGGSVIAPYNVLFEGCSPAVFSNGEIQFSNNVGLGLLSGAAPQSSSGITFFGNFTDQLCLPDGCAPTP